METQSEMVFVTTVIGYRDTIARVFEVLHCLPLDFRVVIHLSSLSNYRAFWLPVDKELFPHDPFIPVGRQKKLPEGRAIVVSTFFTERQLGDVLITFHHKVHKDVRGVVRIQFTPCPSRDLLQRPQQLFLVEDPYTVRGDETMTVSLQTDLAVKSFSFFRQVGLIHDVTKTLMDTKALMTIRCRPGKVGFVPGHFIVIVSSDLDIMYELYRVLHDRGVSVHLNVEDFLSDAGHRRLSNGCRSPFSVNVMVVQDTFKEMAAALTYATQVIVADTLVNPLVMKHLWALAFSVRVTVYRVDLRFTDGGKGFVESPEVLRLLYPNYTLTPPEISATDSEASATVSHEEAIREVLEECVSEEQQVEALDEAQYEALDEALDEARDEIKLSPLQCHESLPAVPILRFNGVTYPICQLTLADLFAGASAGAHTFVLLHQDAEVEGWLDYSVLSTLAALFPNSMDPAPIREDKVIDLWSVLCEGKHPCLSQIDWAALITLLLCRVVLPASATIVVARRREFHYGDLCDDLASGVVWGVDLCTANSQDPIRLYDFSNSVALLGAGDTSFNDVLLPEINVFM